MVVVVRIRVCPECGAYHGSSTDHDKDLSLRPRHKKTEDRQGMTDEQAIAERGSALHCPYCLPSGKRVLREIHEFRVQLAPTEVGPIRVHNATVVGGYHEPLDEGDGIQLSRPIMCTKPVVVIDELQALIEEHGVEAAMEILDAAASR